MPDQKGARMKRMLVMLTVISGLVFAVVPAKAPENTGKTQKEESSTAKTADTDDKAHLDAAYKLLESMNMKETYSKILERLTDNLISKIPTLKNNRDKIIGFYKKYIGWEAIKDDQAEIYKKYFSIKEIKDLMAFYETETGKKTLSILPEIMAEGQALAQKKMIAHIDELKKIIAESLKKYQEDISSKSTDKGEKK
jgi:hypothetical protein